MILRVIWVANNEKIWYLIIANIFIYFLAFIGVATKYATLILGTATALGSRIFNWSIGGFIANALDFNGDGYVFT